MIKTITPLGVIEDATTEAQSVLRMIQDRWNLAGLIWDVEALTAMYTPDAVMYGGRPGMSIGHAGMRQYFSSYVDMLASTKMELKDQVMIRLAPNVYLAQGYGVFQFTLRTGKKSDTTMRTTLVLVEREKEWKILQHHFSSTPDKPPIPQ
jgi:uncharacterized protein (TIGR02246 family)